jgi:hypothetical protein
MPRRLPLGLLVLVLAACGGGEEARPTPEGATPIGMSGPQTGGGETPEATEGSVELTLRLPDGTFLEVGEQRGHPVLLYVFATFDGVSQMLLTPLRNVAERHPDVRIIGIAAQPSARLLVDAYVHALAPPFPITYDPRETVRSGESALGAIDTIPTLIVLDARGVEVARHTGFADEPQIEALLAAAE